MTHRSAILCLMVVACSLASAPCQADVDSGLSDATVFIIRHAEKPDEGDGLTADGEKRAKSYVTYFQSFALQPVKFDTIFAALDSKNSHRPRLTVEPLAHALGLTVDASYKAKDYQRLVDMLRARHGGRTLLLCWHHGELPALLRALGADPDYALPYGRWPDDVYNWVVILRYNKDSQLQEARREVEPF